MNKKSLLVFAGLLSLSAPAFASTAYRCEEGGDRIELTLDENGAASFSDGSTPATADDFNCQPHGQGGALYVGGDGPNAWGYRLPEGVSGQARFRLQFVWDEDSDGMACEYKTIQCVRE